MTSYRKWWEKEPLRFECQTGCFKCCTKPGVVYFDKASIENASKILRISSELFRKEFLLWDDGHWVHEVANGDPCAFLAPEGCSIHNGKPIQCRSYPFWKENMNTKKWNNEISKFCPGINKGGRISKKEIDKIINEDEDNEKRMFMELG